MNDQNIRNAAQIFSKHIVNEYIARLKGENINRLANEKPEDNIMLGKLSSDLMENKDNTSSVQINSIGISFKILKEDFNDCKVSVSIKGDFFYRVFPDLQEQREKFCDEINENTNMEIESFNSLEENKDVVKNTKSDIAKVYKKVSLSDYDFNFKLNLGDIYDFEEKYGFIPLDQGVNEKISQKISRLINDLYEEDDIYCQLNDKVYFSHIKNEDSWAEFIDKNKNENKRINLNWDLKLSCEISPFNKREIQVKVSIENNSEDKSYGLDNRCNTLFNSGISIKAQNFDFADFEMSYFEDDYKYDTTQKANGINCTIVEKDNYLSTTHIPIYEQYKLKTRKDREVKFEDLISSPINNLEKVSEEMRKELESWRKDLKERLGKDELTPNGQEQFEEEIKDFKREIERFELGIRVIKDYEIVKKAFELMNKTFNSMGNKFDSWRAFQIVYIVSLIPDIASCDKNLLSQNEIDKANIDMVDLIYFPTGGGKTEAFLGGVVFNLFFDRLREKNVGLTALIKYPLRLLSVQQVQRLANVLAQAEIIRRKNIEGLDSEKFSLGYYVGSKNTPNRIKKDSVEEIKNMGSKELENNYKILESCPFCGRKEVEIAYDNKENSLMHRCKNSNCEENNLPLYIVDYKIYRVLPSVIVGTIDKLASIGFQRRFGNLLGAVKYKCPEHGYTSKENCLFDSCSRNTEELEKVDLYDSPPTLMVQDELHLVRESLGVFDSHYEGFLNYYIENLSGADRPLKIVGATATISSYDKHVRHLYKKKPLKFPATSPYKEENFYSYLDKNEIHRYILGYAPFGKAIVNSVVYSLKYLRKIVYEYYETPQKVIDIDNIGIETEQEALKLIEYYWIMLEYNNVKRDGNRVVNAIDNPINPQLKSEGVQPFKVRKMTGDDTFQDVRKILSEVEDSEDKFSGLNLITATSMISHGVDADEFNKMFFYGMPRNTAEYIQAYSRAGRKLPGIIIMVLRPTREKDQSYLNNFIRFHKFKDILVEPVPINRWANNAIKDTFSGVLTGLLINYYDNLVDERLDMMKSLKKAIEKGVINKNEIKDHILEIYGCKDQFEMNIKKGNLYAEYIEKSVNEFFDNIISISNVDDCYITEAMEKLEIGAPMFSLRNTEETVQIELIN